MPDDEQFALVMTDGDKVDAFKKRARTEAMWEAKAIRDSALTTPTKKDDTKYVKDVKAKILGADEGDMLVAFDDEENMDAGNKGLAFLEIASGSMLLSPVPKKKKTGKKGKGK